MDSKLAFDRCDAFGDRCTEILKGPASVLFGKAEPGGIINVVTKQPLTIPYYAAHFNFGNYAFYRPSFDISRLLTEDNSLLYRLNVAYQNSGIFRDFNFTVLLTKFI